MFIDILNKLMWVVFFLSILNIVREGYFLLQALLLTKEKVVRDKRQLFILALSIAYFLTSLCTGITF